MQSGNNNTCPLTVQRMFSIFDSHTYTIDCRHGPLAVVTVNFVDDTILIGFTHSDDHDDLVVIDAGAFEVLPNQGPSGRHRI